MALINAKGVSPGNVVFRHIDILVPQYPPDECLVMCGRKGGHQCKQKENNERIKYFPVVFPYDQRKLGLPETGNARGLFLFVPVDPQVDAGGKAVEVQGYLAVRIESPGISEVVYKIGELRGHFIGIGSRFILILPPLVYIFLDKETFSHWKNLALYLWLNIPLFIYQCCMLS